MMMKVVNTFVRLFQLTAVKIKA